MMTTPLSQTVQESAPASRWTPPLVARALLTTLLVLYSIALFRAPGFALMDNINLPVHETGHLVFGAFGEFIAALGGSLFQVMVPLAFVIHFMRRDDSHSASVALWWTGQSLWNVAIYVADAQEQELPLVGGGEHDWAYLLAEMDLLRQDDAVASMVRFAGTMLIVAAMLWGYRSLLRSARGTGDTMGIPRAA